MDNAQRRRSAGSRFPALMAAASLALVGLSPSVLFVNAASAASTHMGKPIVISTSENPQVGMILVSTRPLYTLRASKTPCTARCLKIWPEVLLPKGVSKAKAGHGVSAAKLGTVKRSNGALQVTYSGKALYWFSGDRGVGQVHGNVTDTWGRWSAVVTAKPAGSAAPQPTSGTAVTPTTAATSTTPTSEGIMPAPTPAATPTPTTTAPSSGGVAF